MIRSLFSPVRALVLVLACWSPACFAQTPDAPAAQPAPPPPGDTVRLSDEERNAILDSNTVSSAAAARGELEGSGSFLRNIHGEVGAMIGSNGTRGAYGVADIPLGDNAGATVSFESSRYGGYGRRR